MTSSAASWPLCEPRWATPRTPGRRTRGAKVAQIAEALGQPLMPWQRQVVDVGLEETPDGLPAYREIICTVPRQNGKTLLLLACELERAIGREQAQRIAYTAQDGGAARKKLLDDQVPLIESSPLRSAVRRVRRANDNTSLVFRNGSIIDVLASSATAGHGKTLDLAVVDEAMADDDDRREQALVPTMATRPGAQMLVISTAGTDASILLRRKVDAGRQSVSEGLNTGIAYFEWSAPDELDPYSPSTWRACMPALGWTITEDVVAHARLTMTEGEFRRAFLNQWTSASERVIPDAVWRRVVGTASPDGRLVFFVEVARDRSMGSIAAADERGHVELVDYRPGVSWLPGRLAELTAKWSAPVRLDAGGPAGYLAAEVPDVEPLNGREMLQATAWFYDRVADGALVVREHPALESAITAAVRKVVGDSWVWARQSNDVDVSPLVAITGAAWCARRPDEPPAFFAY